MPSHRTLAARSIFAVIPAALLALAGCASSGSGSATGGSGANDTGGSTASAPATLTLAQLEQDPFYRLGFRKEWAGYATVAQGARLTVLETLGDALVAQDSSNVFTLLNTAGGDARWSTPLATPLTRFVGTLRNQNRLIVCSDSEVFLLDVDTGSIVTKQMFKRVVNTKPVMVGPILVFGTANNAAIGHLLTNGLEAWAYGLPGPVTVNPVALGEGKVGVVSQGGVVLVVDASTGQSSASYKIFDGVDGSLGFSDSQLFVPGLDQSLWAFDLYGNKARWRVRTEAPLRRDAVAHSGNVYTEIPGVGLSAYAGHDGRKLWSNNAASGNVIGVGKGHLLVWNGRTLARLDIKTGQTVSEAELPGVSLVKADKFVDGNLYVGYAGGKVVKFQPR
jgi:outer membrane protein assembly factor BamB